MKKLLYILLLLPVLVFGQTIENNRIVFRETFDDEFSVRRNGGTPTDVVFSEGKGTFNGSSSKIVYPLTYLSNGYTISVRAKRETITDTYAVLFGYQANYAGLIVYENGDIVMTTTAGSVANNWNTVWTDKDFYHLITFTVAEIGANKTVTLYFDGVSQGLSGETTYEIGAFVIGDFVTDLDKEWIGDIDLVEIYNYALSVEEVSNLYNNSRFRDIGQANEVLNVSAQSGSIIDRQGNTLTNTATTVFKHGDASVMEFNGSSSVIETTLANTIKTVSFWIYTDDLTQSIVDFGSGNTVTVSGGTITAAWADNIYIDGETSTAISVNQWYLVTLSDAGIAVTDIDIGKEGANFYKGFLNDFHLYDGILTVEEISQLFSSTKHLYAK